MSLDFVRDLLSRPRARGIGSASDLREHLRTGSGHGSVERAARGGHAAVGLGWAFASGYQAALSRLLPRGAARACVAALCATEEGGGHPRAIRATLTREEDRWRLSGRKTWVTLGLDAELLLVVASAGEEAGRNCLRVAVVPADREGVALEPGMPLPFAPEIGHARLALADVVVGDEELLPGDGYDTVLKPFRTIEDQHVLSAILGWSLGVASESAWSRAWRAEATSALAALESLGAASPSTPETHVALAGVFSSSRRLLDEADWGAADPTTREGWQRDRPLLDVASGAWSARLEAAWRSLSPAG